MSGLGLFGWGLCPGWVCLGRVMPRSGLLVYGFGCLWVGLCNDLAFPRD